MSPRSDLLASLVTFHVRLWLGGLILAALVPVSLGAALLNFLSGTGPKDGPYGHVHRRAEALDAWLKSVGREPRQSPAETVRESASAPRARTSA